MPFDPSAPPAGYVYLFHYADYASVRSIVEDGVFAVRQVGRFGSGMYVTDVIPEGDVREEVADVAFGGGPSEFLDGVLVLLDSRPPSFFVENEPGNWSCTAAIWDDIDLDDTMVALGRFRDGAWEWELNEY